MTPNAEKGTAHLPCYQNNTLADNDWIAFKQFCLHTSKNALDYSFLSTSKLHLHLPSPARQRRKTKARGVSAALTSWTAFCPGDGEPRDRLPTVVPLGWGRGPGQPVTPAPPSQALLTDKGSRYVQRAFERGQPPWRRVSHRHPFLKKENSSVLVSLNLLEMGFQGRVFKPKQEHKAPRRTIPAMDLHTLNQRKISIQTEAEN